MMFCEKVNFVMIVVTLTLIKLNCAANSDKKQDAKCLLPMEPGPCRMKLNRFYYNANTDTCEEFKFGGCMGNDNKFGFKQTCEAACKKSIATPTAPKAATATPSTRETTTMTQFTTKQLKTDTINALNTNVAATSTTTVKPGAASTAVKMPTPTPKKAEQLSNKN